MQTGASLLAKQILTEILTNEPIISVFNTGCPPVSFANVLSSHPNDIQDKDTMFKKLISTRPSQSDVQNFSMAKHDHDANCQVSF